MAQKHPLDTISLAELTKLQRSLINLCGGTIGPTVRDPETGFVYNGFTSMAYAEFPPERMPYDALSSSIIWAPSFVPADVRAKRLEKNWAPSVVSGLAIVTDELHQQFINMGRRAKALIDMEKISPEIRSAVGRIFVPGKAGSKGLNESEMEQLSAALKDPKAVVPLKIRLGDDKSDIVTLPFANTEISERKTPLLYMLIGLHALAGGNVSRFREETGKTVPMPEHAFTKGTGAAEDAVVSLKAVQNELIRQLGEMKKHDKRLSNIDPETVINRQFDLDRAAFGKVLSQQKDFLQLAVPIARLTQHYFTKEDLKFVRPIPTDPAIPILKLIELAGEYPQARPVMKNADYARRLLSAAKYRVDAVIERHGDIIPKNLSLDLPQFKQLIEDIAKASPDNPDAVIKHPSTVKFLKLTDFLAKTVDDKPLADLPYMLGIRKSVIERVDTTMRGEKSWLDRNIIDTRRRSATVQALKEGYSGEQIGQSIEKVAERDGKKFSKRLLSEIHKQDPQGPSGRS
ncbi:MAG: hypothetical protein EBV03_01775 [Proteobacteria bacterium]|nr:hypothetical protein [Pseudomonadota bacterium]